MFKKLKKRIEDGEDGGIDRLTFSPTKLPGSVVRSRPSVTPEDEESPSPRTSETVDGEAEGQDQATEGPELVDGKNTEISGSEEAPLLVPTRIPDHLQSSLKADSANAMLLAKIDELQQEQVRLGEEMDVMKRRHLAERATWEEDTAGRIAEKDQQYHQLEMKANETDGERTELKLQIVELQIEKAEMEQRLEAEVKHLGERVETLEQEKSQEKERFEEEISTLKVTLDETEKSLMVSEDRVSELETKVKNLDTRVDAYSTSIDNEVIHKLQNEVCDNEVIHKLQNEVQDVETRMRARNVDIEILQTRIAAAEREKQDKLQVGIDRQEALGASCKELKKQLSEKNTENLQLYKELEKLNQCVEEKEKELLRVRAEVEEKNGTCEELEQQIEEMRTSEVEQVRQEKDAKISELSQLLDRMRAELFELEFMQSGRLAGVENDSFASLPPNAFSSKGDTQRENSPAILPVAESQPKHSASDSLGGEDLDLSLEQNGEPATMQSHGLEEELQFLRREQLVLQGDLSEKNKIIKVQQQKIMDMRKALNRELKSQSSVDTNKRETSPLTRVAIASDVNFQYLKHVIIKFISSREDEALQLVRAISTLLEFSPEEEQHVRGYLDYKLSWFGSLPPPLYQPLLRRTL